MSTTIMKLVIQALTKVAMGHQQHTTGSGAHKTGPRRDRTRQQRKVSLRKELV